MYEYVRSRPGAFTDPTGKWILNAIGAAVGFAHGALSAAANGGSIGEIIGQGLVEGVIGAFVPTVAFASAGGAAVGATIGVATGGGFQGAVAGANIGGMVGGSVGSAWAVARAAPAGARWTAAAWELGYDAVGAGVGAGAAMYAGRDPVPGAMLGMAGMGVGRLAIAGGKWLHSFTPAGIRAANSQAVTAAEVRATIARQGEQAVARAGGAVGDGGDNIARDTFGNQLALPATTVGPRILNLGSGSNPMAGAVNSDIYHLPGVDVVTAPGRLPFGTGYFDEVVVINPAKATGIDFDPLALSAPVLRSGGTLTIVGQDSNHMLRIIKKMPDGELLALGFRRVTPAGQAPRVTGNRSSFGTAKTIDGNTIRPKYHSVILERVGDS